MTPLKLHSTFRGRTGPVVLVIMDGVGIGKQDESDGVFLAETPTLDALKKSPLYTQLKAHGTAVGMPTDEDMGNSEVGHNALGAGRVFAQGASLVKDAIATGALFEGETWKKVLNNVQTHHSTLHFMGLLSDGNVHAHIDHLIALVQNAHQHNISRIRFHLMTDGRDVSGRSALSYVQKLETIIAGLTPTRDYKIASGGGRMLITMDRYNADWDMVKKGWDLHVLGEGPAIKSVTQHIEEAYAKDTSLNDQYMPPFVVHDDQGPIGSIQDHDSVVFFNFRGDRAIEMCLAFEDPSFKRFDRKRVPNVLFAGMMQYDGDLKLPKLFLVNPPAIPDPLSHYFCDSGIVSFAISETQKYGHVTYFWNGNNSGYINDTLETYIEVPSDRIPFDQAPKMKAQEITDKTIELIEKRRYRFGRINYPNGDMVGHTGIEKAIITSVEETDRCLKQIIDKVSEFNGITVVLADHGNADEMFTEKNGVRTPKTSHTLNPVPFAILDPLYKGEYTLRSIDTPGLANVAATLCNLLGYEAPAHFAPSLIEFK